MVTAHCSLCFCFSSGECIHPQVVSGHWSLLLVVTWRECWAVQCSTGHLWQPLITRRGEERRGETHLVFVFFFFLSLLLERESRGREAWEGRTSNNHLYPFTFSMYHYSWLFTSILLQITVIYFYTHGMYIFAALSHLLLSLRGKKEKERGRERERKSF